MMKKLTYSFFIFFFIEMLLSGCMQNSQPKNIKHVIVIGIDGMSVGGVDRASTPNFDVWMKDGAYSLNTRNVLPTISSPNWEAMLTGSGVALTGVTSNDWRVDNYSLPPIVTTENGRYPDIFYVLKTGNNSLKTSAIYQWDGFAHLYDHHFVDLDFDCEDEWSTTAKAADVLKNDKPNFMFVHLDHCDHAGHTSGHMTPDYLKAVELADELAGEIVNAAKEAGIFDETLFIIVVDHGGKGRDHGHETLQGNEVPFILYGNSVKKGYKIPAAVNLYDVAATSAFALGVERPQVWQGKPVECAFTGFPEPKNLVGKFMAPSTCIPTISPRKLNGEAGGLFVGQKAMVTIESTGTEGKIRYTTDGSIPSAQSEVYRGPFEMAFSGVVKAAYFGNDGSQSDYSKGYFRVLPDAKEDAGVNYALYKSKDLKKLPDFASLVPISKGKTMEISLDEIEEKIGESIGVVFQGWININTDGEYTFAILSDDGSKLFIDQTEVVNNDGDHGVQEREGSINLTKGKHPIRVIYFNGGGGWYLNCLYSGPGVVRQIISPEVLTIR